MSKLLGTGALILVMTNILAGCSLLPKFSDEPELGAAHASTAGSALTIGGVLFASEAAVLPAEANKIVNRAALYLLENPDSSVIVEGHTDHVGDESYNQMLSEMRAGTIVRALRNKGISSSRITAVGYGESKPVADNKTPAGRQANRRVELVFK